MLVRLENTKYSDTDYLPLIVDIDFENITYIKILKTTNSEDGYSLSINISNKKLGIEFPDFVSTLAAFDQLWALYQNSTNRNDLYLREGV